MTHSPASAERTRLRVLVTGTVQGVGFRPFVYRNAVALGLAGTVRNDGHGVVIDATGERAALDELVRRVRDQPPRLARVDQVAVEDHGTGNGDIAPEPAGFRIVGTTDAGGADAPVSVDTATCPACLAEVDDPADRRHRYPFTNCTDCGPRYTIVRRVPYDRPATTMAGFAMCARCRAEYLDPDDRRFHAQPNACPDCGPQLAWRTPDGTVTATGDEALARAVDALRHGGIVAVKGLGGYHLACDATDGRAVAELRRRKARDDKPFAVMVADLGHARALCHLDDDAAELLGSPQRPIVLVPRRAGAVIAADVAPGLSELGLMLAYTPLHHLLMSDVGRPLVMTSGNRSDEPIAHQEPDAIDRLGPIVDGLLTHDRPIEVRCDDSVVRATSAGLQVLRRSRGATPEPLRLPVSAARPVLAVGAQLKSTIAVARDDLVIASHHLGDLEHLATFQAFRQALDHLPRLSGIVPEVVAHDLHPEYLSTKVADDLDLPAVAVQHHHAHVAACLVEHGRVGPVLGIAFDGTGYGTDGTVWGGELLVADLVGFERVGHLRPVALPGGAAAIREPWRMAQVWAEVAGREVTVAGVDAAERDAVRALAEQPDGLMTTSAGRLFDAVAALVGGRARVTYEAQAAIELEALAARVPRHEVPCWNSVGWSRSGGGPAVLDPSGLVARVIDERAQGTPPEMLAAAFHLGFGRAVAALAAGLAAERGLDTVVLTGGVFQNALLSEVMRAELEATGLCVLEHHRVPPNDGGISIGQAAIAAARSREPYPDGGGDAARAWQRGRVTAVRYP